MTFVAVAPRFRIAGFDGRRRNVSDAFEVLELRDALTRVYSTDAHLVTYVVPGASRHPLLSNSEKGTSVTSSDPLPSLSTPLGS